MREMVLDFYRDSDGDWRWTVKRRRGGKVVGASTEGYRRRIDAVGNAKLVLRLDRMDVTLVGASWSV